MMPASGWDIRNIFSGPNLALLAVYVGALLLLGLLHFSFKGSVVV